MICSSCGSENLPGQRFCGSCGTPQAVACTVCGSANPAGQRFCGSCGTELAGSAGETRPAAAAGAAATPGAERRLVSVLFADLVGFTPFAEEQDAEDVRETLTRYFAIATRIVERYGGTIEKFIGDAVMAVWGAPTAREDDAERAVRAGLDLVDAVQELGPGIAARAGVMTGEAAVTIGQVNQGMVAGDLVNTAARVQSVAPPGGVLVGEATMRAAGAAITFEAAGDQTLKGKSSPVATWRAVRVVAQRGGHGRSDLPEPPFVGREDELRLLKDLVGSGDRRTQLVSITGPGGIGKSRLAWELEKYIDGIAGDVYWHRGRSPSFGDGITFWALGEMVRRRAGLAEDDDADTSRARIHATVAEYVTEDDDRRWVEPALLTLLGVEPSPAGGRDVLFAAWRIFFERIAERGPTILLFEDLQWADSGLLDFIEHLLEWSRGVPLLVVTLARPELFDRRPDWGAATRQLTRLDLEPLGDDAMRRLLAGFVPGLPDAAADAIIGRADGVPLYAVEIVRSLVADGRIELVDGVYRPVGELGLLSVPDTLRSLIASRLDTLDPADRSLVADASVLGQVFTTSGLAAMSGVAPETLAIRLRFLVRRQLFDIEVDPASPERGQYRFVQSLIREVAYATLARRERRDRHLTAARFYESLGDEELAGALANHYVSAHAASEPGPEANAVAVQARLALGAAADRAVDLGAHDQAISYLRAAIAITTDPRDRGHLLLRAAESARPAADMPAAEAFAEEARAIAAASDDPEAAALATALLGEILIDNGRVDRAVVLLEETIAGLPATISDVTRAGLYTTLSHALMRTGASDVCIEAADKALAIAEHLDLELIVSEALNNKGSALGYLGRRREALALLRAAVDIARANGYVASEIRALMNVSASEEDVLVAHDVCVEAFELAIRVGNRSLACWTLESRRFNAYWRGDNWDDALAHDVFTELDLGGGSLADLDAIRSLWFTGLLAGARGVATDDLIDRAAEHAARVSDPLAVSCLQILRSERFLFAGEFRAAFDGAIWESGYADSIPLHVLLTARAALWAGDLDRAHDVVRLATGVAMSDSFLLACRGVADAAVAALEGRPDEALTEYRSAIAAMFRIHADFTAACVCLDLVVALGPAHPAAGDAAANARRIFERCGARAYLERLDTALAGDGVVVARPTGTAIQSGALAE